MLFATLSFAAAVAAAALSIHISPNQGPFLTAETLKTEKGLQGSKNQLLGCIGDL